MPEFYWPVTIMLLMSAFFCYLNYRISLLFSGLATLSQILVDLTAALANFSKGKKADSDSLNRVVDSHTQLHKVQNDLNDMLTEALKNILELKK